MADDIFVFRDIGYLCELGLDSGSLDALLLVFQSEGGPTGLDNSTSGRCLINTLLSSSISISSTGKVTIFQPSGPVESFLNSMLSNDGIAIHAPDAEILSEALKLAGYQKAVTLWATYARLGKKKELPASPLLTGLSGSPMERNACIKWLLSHCSSISKWNRYTEYGVHPTVIAAQSGDFLDLIQGECQKLGISFHEVLTEKELPCW